MTEAEWLACDDPIPMLEALRGRASERKLRLFAVACCRRIWGLLTEHQSRRAVETTELFADGLVTDGEWTEAGEEARDAFLGDGAIALDAPVCLYYAAAEAALHAHANVVRAVQAEVTWNEFDEEGLRAAARERTAHASLLRDVLGDPFRPAPAIDPRWLAWNGGTVPRIARAVYAGRAFDRLPVLADALEDAGCRDFDLLAHCRSGGDHVRGCWVIDLLLGKE